MKKFVASLLLGSILSACAHRELSGARGTQIPTSPEREKLLRSLVLDHGQSKNPERTLTRETAARDLDVLSEFLEHGYGGAKFVPGDKIPRALAGLAKLRGELPEMLTSTKLCRAAADAIGVIPDRHFELMMTGEPCRKEPETVAHVGPNFGKDDNAAWEMLSTSIRVLGTAQKIPVLALHFFPTKDAPEWDGFRTAVERQVKVAPALIIDLRGNHGGYDGQGSWLADLLYGGSSPSGYRRMVNRQTPEALLMFINMLHVNGEMQLAKKGEKIPADLATYAANYRENFELALRGKIADEDVIDISATEKAVPYDAKKAFDHPIYILVDRLCGSSGESTLSFLRQNPRAKVIGENTYGAIHFGNLGVVELPASGIALYAGTHYVEDAAGKFYEGSGYVPDVRTPAGKDAMDWVRKDLERTLR